MMTLAQSDPRRLATAWRAVDPDPETRAETDAILAAGDGAVAARFSNTLEFGTAGLRGALGAGPARMNRVLVRVVAAALAERLLAEGDAPRVVIGFDARRNSDHFAWDTARVLAARGARCTVFPEPVPTPLLAFAVGRSDAAAGVMVTASHNPRTDNGYKVYWRGGAQIVPPIDAEISALIAATPLLGDDELAPIGDPGIAVESGEMVEAYLAAVVGQLEPAGPRRITVAYTPLHGVGRDVLLDGFVRAGFPVPAVVASQGEPDGGFPTTPFPNPEESGVLGPLLALAGDIGADVAIANDPDADRLAVAVPNGPRWRLLTGDELGSIIADHLLSKSEAADRLVLNTIVSSRLLPAIAAQHGVTHLECLTGFKWIMDTRRRHRDLTFVMGYEEALGYTVGDVVADKDGIGTALVVAELVAQLATRGETLLDRLDELHLRHGVHVTGQRSLVFEPGSADAMATLRAHAPLTLGGDAVLRCVDLAHGGQGLPPTNGLIFELRHARLVVRPSGTEPKVKLYGEVTDVPDAPLGAARDGARRRLCNLLDALAVVVADPERRAVEASMADAAREATRGADLASRSWRGVERADALRFVVQCIDLTTLAGDDTPGRVRALCAQARRPDPADPTVGPTAAVCVYPALVPVAAALLGGTPVAVASVATAFPSGLSSLAVRVADIADAIAGGADEIDVVINRSAMLAGRDDVVAAELQQFREATAGVTLKVILEVAELEAPELIARAADIAIEAGADLIKTSTGKGPAGASPEAVLVMAERVAAHHVATGKQVGIKVAGGVRTAADALGYVAIIDAVLGAAWLDPRLLRFGASSLIDDVVVDLARTEAMLR